APPQGLAAVVRPPPAAPPPPPGASPAGARRGTPPPPRRGRRAHLRRPRRAPAGLLRPGTAVEAHRHRPHARLGPQTLARTHPDQPFPQTLSTATSRPGRRFRTRPAPNLPGIVIAGFAGKPGAGARMRS